MPSEDDSNAARWELHPTWVVIQQAFTDETAIARDEQGEPLVDGDGVVQMVEPCTIVRKRKQQVNIARAVKAVFGHLATLAAYLRNTTSRLGRPYSSRTIETYSRDVMAFFRWLVEHKHLKVNPVARVKKPKTEKALIRVFTEDELACLDAACDRAARGKSLTSDERKALAARDRAFLWLLLSTGIRLSEGCGLLFSDIDWDSGMIYVRGKGAKERRIPIGKVARQHLHTYITYWRGAPSERDEHVFLNAFGKPLRKQAAHDMFARLKRVAGITDKRVSPHTCRHWFAVNCIRRGMPSTALQALLGHETLEMINTYVRLAEQDKRDIYAQFSPVDALEMHHTAKGKRQEIRAWRNARRQKNKH